MKHLIFILILLASCSSSNKALRNYTQDLPYQMEFVEGKGQVKAVIDFPGKSKSEIFNSVNLWVAKNYRSSNDVVQLQDKEAGTIVCKGGKYVTIKSMGKDVQLFHNHSLQIDIKEGKMRAIFDNIWWDGPYGKPKYGDSLWFPKCKNQVCQQHQDRAIETANSIISSIEDSIRSSSSDDW